MRTRIRDLEQQVVRAATQFTAIFDLADETVDPLKKGECYLQLQAACLALRQHRPADITTTAGAVGANSPQTSHTAASLARLTLMSSRHKIIGAIRTVTNTAQMGLTIDELEGPPRSLGAHTTISSAVNWLVQAGWLCDSGFTRQTRAKRPAIVWVLTPAGREATHADVREEEA